MSTFCSIVFQKTIIGLTTHFGWMLSFKRWDLLWFYDHLKRKLERYEFRPENAANSELWSKSGELHPEY